MNYERLIAVSLITHMYNGGTFNISSKAAVKYVDVVPIIPRQVKPFIFGKLIVQLIFESIPPFQVHMVLIIVWYYKQIIFGFKSQVFSKVLWHIHVFLVTLEIINVASPSQPLVDYYVQIFNFFGKYQLSQNEC